VRPSFARHDASMLVPFPWRIRARQFPNHRGRQSSAPSWADRQCCRPDRACRRCNCIHPARTGADEPRTPSGTLCRWGMSDQPFASVNLSTVAMTAFAKASPRGSVPVRRARAQLLPRGGRRLARPTPARSGQGAAPPRHCGSSPPPRLARDVLLQRFFLIACRHIRRHSAAMDWS
jgi:hypothetical protein